MTRKIKKEKELSILRMIYKKKRFPKYTLSEKPDFILHHLNDIGVEISEYYPDETTARLQNKPNYVEQLLDKTYIHKDDVSKLDIVCNIEVQDKKTGIWKKIENSAISQENRPIQDRIALLIRQINGKSSIFNTYKKGLKYIDLVIYDSRNSLFDGINDIYAKQTFVDINSRSLFINSGFKNIFLIIPPSIGRDQKIFQLK